jgi:hypothetical protein
MPVRVGFFRPEVVLKPLKLRLIPAAEGSEYCIGVGTDVRDMSSGGEPAGADDGETEWLRFSHRPFP